MNIQENNIIGELVAQDYRAASVFKNMALTFVVKAIEPYKMHASRKKLTLLQSYQI